MEQSSIIWIFTEACSRTFLEKKNSQDQSLEKVLTQECTCSLLKDALFLVLKIKPLILPSKVGGCLCPQEKNVCTGGGKADTQTVSENLKKLSRTETSPFHLVTKFREETFVSLAWSLHVKLFHWCQWWICPARKNDLNCFFPCWTK